MPDEVLHYLKLKAGGKFIDCTLGGAGHVLRTLDRILPNGKILGIDLDPIAITAAKEVTKKHKDKTVFVRDEI